MNPWARHFIRRLSVDKLSAKEFLWYRWSEAKSIAYVNIIDYQGKIDSSETIPWFNIPNSEDEIQRYSQLSVYRTYKLYIVDKILASENIFIPELIQSVLRICKLYSLVIDSGRQLSLYIELIHLLHKKSFNDSATFLNLWNSLCGNSNESKAYVLGNHIERHHEEKSFIMLNYILNIAQASHFNFWGIWFKENEEDHLSFCPVTLALLKGNLDHLFLLLQYGFQQNNNRISIYDKYYYYVHDSIYAWLKAPLDEREPGRSAVVTEVLLFLIQISKVRSKSRLQSLIKCFHLLWSVNTVPFVTEFELVNEINNRYQSPPGRYGSPSFPRTYKDFINIVEFYEIVMPQDSTNEITPRDLQQLCKHVIRKSLVRSYNLPQGIMKLPLPKKLQAFLRI